VVALAAKAEKEGELRWAATLLNHAVFADATNKQAREQLAHIYTQLGYEAEAGTWRNIYLTGAQELRTGVAQLQPAAPNPDMLSAMTTPMMLDIAAVRIDPVKASARAFKLNLVLNDVNETHLVTVENGVLVHETGIRDDTAGATVSLTRMELVLTLLAGMPPEQFIKAGNIGIEGDTALYGVLTDMVEAPQPNFNIVEP